MTLLNCLHINKKLKILHLFHVHIHHSYYYCMLYKVRHIEIQNETIRIKIKLNIIIITGRLLNKTAFLITTEKLNLRICARSVLVSYKLPLFNKLNPSHIF